MAAEKTVVKSCRMRESEVERLKNLLYNFPELRDDAGVFYQAVLRGMLTLEVQATRPGGMLYGGMSEEELADALVKRIMPVIDFLYDGGYLPARYYRGSVSPSHQPALTEPEPMDGAEAEPQLLVIDEQAASDIEGLGGDFME